MGTAIFPGRLDSLEKIRDFVLRAARQAGLDETAIYAIELSVDEACTNIIEHAYGGEDRGNIEVSCIADGRGLTIRLRDTGKPFNPLKIPIPHARVRLKHLKSRGAGLFLMRKMMDEVHFEFIPDLVNTLTMVKYKK